MVENVISLRGFSKSYGSTKAVDNISFEVKKGEIFCFLGTNGAGKTTTIKALTGQLSFTQGDIRIFGNSIDSNREKAIENTLSRIGVVGDFHCLYRHLTVRENLNFFCELYGSDFSRVDAVLEDLQITDKADAKVSTLSKGLTQRALLAKSILHEPEILFLDEPSTGLDPISTADLHRIIRKMKDKGTTIFLTTHFMDEADELADTVCFIHKGKIVESGAPFELKRKYGRPSIQVIYEDNGFKQNHEVSLDRAGLTEALELSGRHQILSLKSQEAPLKEIFIHLLSQAHSETSEPESTKSESAKPEPTENAE